MDTVVVSILWPVKNNPEFMSLIRADFQTLAEERAKDSQILLGGGQWAGAYYLAGYAVECGLKSCVIAYVEKNPDVVFRVKSYSVDCWTHDLESLVTLAGLKDDRKRDTLSNPALGVNWSVVLRWSERLRYELKNEPDARRFCEAVNDNVNGVLRWIRIRW